MSLSDVVARILAFIRAGYPHGVPPTDYYPLLAVLRHRLTDEEVSAVAAQLAATGELSTDTADISAAITRLTTEVPSAEDLERVRHRLETTDWPIEDR